jgi:hypothetical protein
VTAGSVSRCSIIGHTKSVSEEDRKLPEMKVFEGKLIQKVARVLYSGERFHAAEYSRMSKRVCNVVLLKDESVCALKYFIVVSCTTDVFALVQVAETSAGFGDLSGGKHILSVKLLDTLKVVPISDLQEVLVFMPSSSVDLKSGYVSRRPNKVGHAIFK